MLWIRNLSQSPRSAAYPTPTHDHSADLFINSDAFWRPRSQKRRFDNQHLAGRPFLPLSRQVIFSAPTYPPDDVPARYIRSSAAAACRGKPPGHLTRYHLALIPEPRRTMAPGLAPNSALGRP